FLGMGFNIFDLVVLRTFFVMQNEVLVAIPLFLFMGYLIERAGILDELFHAVRVMFGWLPGSLAVATLATGTVFATATGIVGASVTLLSLLAFPQMAKAKYEKTFSAGAIAASGTLGILIPPGHRRLNFQLIRGSVFLTVRAAAMVGWLLVGSSIFAAVFARLGGSAVISTFVNGLNLSPEGFFWVAQILTFFLGWPLEW